MQDMIHCLNPSVLERQGAHLQWQQQQDTNNFSIENFFSLQAEGIGDGWPNLTTIPQYATVMREEELVKPTTTTTTATISNSTSSVQVGKEKSSSKKRKADQSPLVASDDEEKRMKADQGNEVDRQQGNRREDSGNSSKENTDKKPDYIHVRARRGQATDSHSLAERVRRERISERMKYLQGLVPGCNKITGKAGMLDEIINYVQSLQRQVEFLSMKLAAVNPRLDFNMETLFTKEMNLPCNSSMSTVEMSSGLVDPSFLQFTSVQQAVASCGLEMDMIPAELALRRTISAPLSAPEPFMDPCFNIQRTTSGWDSELHNLYGVEYPQGRGPAFLFPSLPGNILSSNLKTEM